MKYCRIVLIVCALVLFTSAGIVHAMEADVVVIGGGGGGLAAAVSAAENGASVILVEKMPFLGGNTLLSTGAIYAGTSLLQIGQEAVFPAANIAERLLASADGTSNEALVRFLASESGNTINWLQSMGVEFLPMTGIALAQNGGAGLVAPLATAAAEREVQVLLNTKAISLLMDGDRVAGVTVEQNGQEFEISSNAVVIATGGFAGNREMVQEYKPDFGHLPVTCAPSAVGDGITMAVEIGAATLDLDKVMPVPTAEAETGRVITAMMRGAAGASIIVNERGQRFADETLLYEPLTYIVLDELEKQSRPYVYQVFDQISVDNVPIAATYVQAGITIKADSWTELAELLDINSDTFEDTINQYNANIEMENPDEFGRTSALRPLENGPYYAMKIKPGLLATRGGLKIDQQAQVLTPAGTAIPGLFAAGETTGGIFGGGYQGGAFLTVATTFGRIAGAQAAIEALVQ